MNVKIMKILLVSTSLILPFTLYAEEKLSDQYIQKARTLVKLFGSDLKHVLQASMKSGGPIKALDVCNVQAGPIAQNNALLSHWNIGRTSLKVRNEDNKPDVWELSVLQQFEKRKAEGEDLSTMEYSESLIENGERVYRYMKPIATSGVCLKCHGGTITNEITNKVKALYPNDQAIGFNVGDIRGAFTLKKHLTENGTTQ